MLMLTCLLKHFHFSGRSGDGSLLDLRANLRKNGSAHITGFTLNFLKLAQANLLHGK